MAATAYAIPDACPHCGVIPPLCEAPRGHWALAVWANPKLQVHRLVGQEHRLPPIPAGTGFGPLADDLRLQWVAMGAGKGHAGKGKGKAPGKGKAKGHAAPPRQGKPGSSAAGRPGPHQNVTVIKKTVKVLVRMRPRPRRVPTPPLPPAPPAPLQQPRVPVPVLIVSYGTAEADLAQAVGVNAEVDCRALSDWAARPLRACAGTSGHLMAPAARKEAFWDLLRQAAASITAQSGRPGGAVLGFRCNSGKHRSVLMAEVLAQALEATGRHVEKRHLGGIRTMGCRCGEGPLRDHCPEVARLAGHQFALQSYQAHLELRARVFRAVRGFLEGLQ